MAGERVAIMSLWQNDAATVEARAAHLLEKSHYGPLRWVWVVGDSSDETEARLQAIVDAHYEKDITIVRHDTHIIGEAPATRLVRLSETANAGLDAVRANDDYWLLHESDLRSPVSLVTRFLNTGKCPIAGWVTLGESDVFYDTFAYRKDGVMFSNSVPYHRCYWPDRLFEVDCVGSCWMAHAEDIRAGVRCHEQGVIDLCQQFKERGRTLWVDPRISIVQPVELWVSRHHA
jgi:hypothetical protein